MHHTCLEQHKMENNLNSVAFFHSIIKKKKITYKYKYSPLILFKVIFFIIFFKFKLELSNTALIMYL